MRPLAARQSAFCTSRKDGNKKETEWSLFCLVRQMGLSASPPATCAPHGVAMGLRYYTVQHSRAVAGLEPITALLASLAFRFAASPTGRAQLRPAAKIVPLERFLYAASSPNESPGKLIRTTLLGCSYLFATADGTSLLISDTLACISCSAIGLIRKAGH